MHRGMTTLDTLVIGLVEVVAPYSTEIECHSVKGYCHRYPSPSPLSPYPNSFYMLPASGKRGVWAWGIIDLEVGHDRRRAL